MGKQKFLYLARPFRDELGTLMLQVIDWNTTVELAEDDEFIVISCSQKLFEENLPIAP